MTVLSFLRGDGRFRAVELFPVLDGAVESSWRVYKDDSEHKFHPLTICPQVSVIVSIYTTVIYISTFCR